MKNINESVNLEKNRWLKNVGILLCYWIILFSIFFNFPKALPYGMHLKSIYFSIICIIVFLSTPLLTLIPYRFAKLKGSAEKTIFLLIGNVIPMAFIGFIIIMTLAFSHANFIL